MRTLKIRTDGKAVTALKQSFLFISLLSVGFPAIVRGSGVTAPPAIRRLLQAMFLSGLVLLMTLALSVWLLSRYSPVGWLKIRKELILFRSEERRVGKVC